MVIKMITRMAKDKERMHVNTSNNIGVGLLSNKTSTAPFRLQNDVNISRGNVNLFVQRDAEGN